MPARQLPLSKSLALGLGVVAAGVLAMAVVPGIADARGQRDCPRGLQHRTPEQTVLDHVALIQQGRIDEAMCDFAPDATVILPGQVITGLDNIRAGLDGIGGLLGGAAPEIQTLTTHESTVLLTFSAFGTPCTIPDGSDTYIVRKGHIVVTRHALQRTRCGVPAGCARTVTPSAHGRRQSVEREHARPRHARMRRGIGRKHVDIDGSADEGGHKLRVADGTVHVAYRKNKHLHYARRTGTRWVRRQVTTVEPLEFSFAIDGCGAPHFVTREADGAGYRNVYHRWTAAGFRSTLLAACAHSDGLDLAVTPPTPSSAASAAPSSSNPLPSTARLRRVTGVEGSRRLPADPAYARSEPLHEFIPGFTVIRSHERTKPAEQRSNRWVQQRPTVTSGCSTR